MLSVKQILFEKDHTGVQFLKYVLFGSFAMLVDMVIFFLVAWLLFPALTEDDIVVRLFNLKIVTVLDHMRKINFCIGNVLAFMVSNFVAYILNVFFVFKVGKHSRLKEIGLFYLVSAISVGIGVGIGVLLIHGFGFSTTYSYIAKAISTTLINFVVRKFIIFQG